MGGFNEGDYIRTKDGLYFAVKGSQHPVDMVVGVLRYIPHPEGNRVINGIGYRRLYDLNYSTNYLATYYPRYLNYVKRLSMELQTVPREDIAQHYEPREKLREIMKHTDSDYEKNLTLFIQTIAEYGGLSTNCFGVSGSLLIGAQRETSDIDINIYGQRESKAAYEALKDMRKTLPWVKPLEGVVFESVLTSRWGDTGIPLDRFSVIELNKILHGLVHGCEYFIRLLVPDDSFSSKPIQKVTLKALIMDASKAIYNPCVYIVQQVEDDSKWNLRELKSYRGKFTEQTTKDMVVDVRGTIEEVYGSTGVYHRIVLGGKGDYLLPIGDNY